MHRSGIDILNKIAFFRLRSFRAFTPASLITELIQWSALKISSVGKGYHHFLITIEVIRVKVISVAHNLRTSCIGVLFLHFD